MCGEDEDVGEYVLRGKVVEKWREESVEKVKDSIVGWNRRRIVMCFVSGFFVIHKEESSRY